MTDLKRTLCWLVIFSMAHIGPSRVSGEEFKIVVPSGLENMDGNSSGTAANGPDRFRNQFLFRAAQFASLPATHRLITAFALRPDAQVTSPVGWHFDALEMRMSTTETDELSPTFAENIGADEALFYSGSLTAEADGTGPIEGPRDFFRVAWESGLPTPFYYDPMLGNLLVDIVVVSDVTATLPFSNDTQEMPYTALQAGNSNEPEATFASSELPAIEFTFDSGPPVDVPGDYNAGGSADAADYTVWRDHLGAPAGSLPNDVDGGAIGPAQYATWKANFGTTLGSGLLTGTTIPEPASVWLLIVPAAVVYLRTRSRWVLEVN